VAGRLRRIEEEFGGRVQIVWRSFLLRPRPDPSRTLEKFRTYTQSWLRPAADEDAPTFRVWQTDEGLPSHSVPPHLVAKAAAMLGADAFQRMHERLLQAYFAENRDITNTETLAALWREAGLPDSEFARYADPALLQQTLAEHNEAIEIGVTGVPAARMDGNDAIIVGAQPIELYRRWVSRALAERNPETR
jgi:predicted DsbA family dithiol-disulfide isomerase